MPRTLPPPPTTNTSFTDYPCSKHVLHFVSLWQKSFLFTILTATCLTLFIAATNTPITFYPSSRQASHFLSLLLTTVPDRMSVKCLDHWDTRHQPGWQSACREGEGPNSKRAAGETQQRWRTHVLKVSLTHSKSDSTYSSGQQIKNITLLHVQFIATCFTSYSYLPHTLTCM
jgi:hypothetical protein